MKPRSDPHIHIITRSLTRYDAVGNLILQSQKLLREHFSRVSIYGNEYVHPALLPNAKYVTSLPAICLDQDLIFFHHSIQDPFIQQLSSVKCKKIIFFHNFTDASFFAKYHSHLSDHCNISAEEFVIYQEVNAILVNSQFTKQTLLTIANRFKLNIEKKITICPPYIVQNTQDSQLPKKNPPQDLPAKYFLFVGRIAPHKKVEDLIFLMSEYHKLCPTTHLLLVGSIAIPEYKQDLDQIINHFPPLKSKIHFLSYLPEGKLAQIYQHASAFISMSEHEGFCIPLIEAMRNHLPVFAYTTTAVAEIIENKLSTIMEKDFPKIALHLHQVLASEHLVQEILFSQAQTQSRLDELSSSRMLLVIDQAIGAQSCHSI